MGAVVQNTAEATVCMHPSDQPPSTKPQPGTGTPGKTLGVLLVTPSQCYHFPQLSEMSSCGVSSLWAPQSFQ